MSSRYKYNDKIIVVVLYNVLGEVKEKEQARKKYKEAVEQGHGAYLMEEEKPVSIRL